jgi:hypothetical protein
LHKKRIKTLPVLPGEFLILAAADIVVPLLNVCFHGFILRKLAISSNLNLVRNNCDHPLQVFLRIL